MSDEFTARRSAWLEQVAEDAGLPASATRIGVVLAGYVNRQTGEAWPAVATLGERLTMSERALQSGLAALEGRGHLLRRIGGGRSRPSRYRLMLKPREDSHPLDEKTPQEFAPFADGNPADLRQKPRRFASETPQESAPDTIEEPIEEPFEKTLSAHRNGKAAERREIDQRFAEWWDQYPKKAEKKAARIAYQKALKGGASFSDLLAGAMRYGAERDGQDPRYTKNPATWLNRGCWEDEPTQPSPPSGGGRRRTTAADIAEQRLRETWE